MAQASKQAFEPERRYIMANEVTFEIREHLGVIAERDNGWKREVTITAWNGGAPKVDIREWDPSYQKMSRGITLPEAEAAALAKVLSARYAVR